MAFKRDLYLLYAPTQGGWGVFNSGSCPDPADFPAYLFRKYEVPSDKEGMVWDRLMDIRSKLVAKEVIPDETNQDVVYPRLEELLKD